MGIFRLSEAFPVFNESGDLPSLNKLVEIIGFVELNAQGRPSGELWILCIRPRNSAHGPQPSWLAPQADYDRIGLFSLWQDRPKQMLLMVHPMDKKPFMAIVDLGPNSFGQVEQFARDALRGASNATLDQLRKSSIADFDVRMVLSVDIQWDNAVMEGTWKLPDYRQVNYYSNL